MSENIHLFRQGEYSTQEMIDRIPASALNSGNGTIRSFCNEIGVDDHSELLKQKKEVLFYRLEANSESDDFEDFVETLFAEEGKRGDNFNYRLFQIPGNISYSKLDDSTSQYKGKNISELTDQDDYLVFLSDKLEDDKEKIIDLQFKSSVDYNELSADDDIPIQIIKEGKVVSEYGSDYSVRAPSQDKIEARVYCDSGLVAVSNFTGTKKKLQKGIVEAITEIGHQP